MNETQKNKMKVLEWIDKVTLSSAGTLEEKIKATKDLYEFVFGDDVQAVPEVESAGKGPDYIIGVAAEKIMPTEICGYVESNIDNQPASLKFGNAIYGSPEATEEESAVSCQDAPCGEPEKDKCNPPIVEKLGCTKCEKQFYIEKHYIETHSINCPFCKSDEVMWGLV